MLIEHIILFIGPERKKQTNVCNMHPCYMNPLDSAYNMGICHVTPVSHYSGPKGQVGTLEWALNTHTRP